MYVIARWETKEGISERPAWCGCGRPSKWVTLHQCMQRYIAEGCVTEILEVIRYADRPIEPDRDISRLSARLDWLNEQLRLRDAEQDAQYAANMLGADT